MRRALTVAAALVVLAGAGAVWLHGPPAPHPRGQARPLCEGCPSATPHAVPSDQGLVAATVEVLTRRPLALPRLAPGAVCPVSSSRSLAPAGLDSRGLGPGPLYVSLPEGLRAGGLERVAWVAAPAARGPVLIRGARLDGGGSLLVGSEGASDVIPEGDAGAAGGLTLFSAVALEALTPPGTWSSIISYAYASVPGCYGWQIDAPGFSYPVIVRAD